MVIGSNNAKGKIEILGGGAELNIAYGLTPPSDTSKLWIQTANEPSMVKIEADNNLTVSSDGNAKTQTVETIDTTYQSYSNYNYLNQHCIKKNGKIYVTNAVGTTKFLNNDISYGYVYVYKNGALTQLCGYATQYFVGLFDYDETHILLFIGGGTTRAYIIDCTNDTYVSKSVSVNANYRDNFHACCCYNKKVYGMRLSLTSSDTAVYFIEYDVENNTIIPHVNISSPIFLGRTYYSYSHPSIVYYNGYLYFVLLSSNQRTDPQYLCRWEIGSSTIQTLAQMPRFFYNDGDYAWCYYEAHIFGNKMIVTNVLNGSTSTPVCNKIYIVDLNNYTYVSILNQSAINYAYSYVFVDENTGDIELWGGYPNDSVNAVRKRKISNIYQLAENNLLLYYDRTATTFINVINEENLTIEAPINHAWLGDSNNIAQIVNMYKYVSGTWKGINCADYSG